MASFGRSMEKLASAVAEFASGVNQRLDENHLVDMMVELNDEDISVSRFSEFTETIHNLRNGKSSAKSKSESTTTTA